MSPARAPMGDWACTPGSPRFPHASLRNFSKPLLHLFDFKTYCRQLVLHYRQCKVVSFDQSPNYSVPASKVAHNFQDLVGGTKPHPSFQSFLLFC